jgi:Fic family protein
MNISDYKSGGYKQGYDYSYFVPSKINHTWVLSDPQIQHLLGEADRAVGALSAYSEAVPDIDYFIRMHLSKEATQSSRIEGTTTNIEEVFFDEQDIDPDKRDDWHEVKNYITAVNDAISRLDEYPFCNRLLKDAHKTLMQGVRGQNKLPGEFRTSQNWIGVSLKNAIFVPPHQSLVVELMSDLEMFLNNEFSAPHLVKIALAHYQFETIHPFLDGNGRLGRLMIALYLSNFKLLYKPALYLSDYFERNKTEYVDRMMVVRQSNDIKGWLIFFLHGVLETAQNSMQVLREVVALRTRLEGTFLPQFSLRRQEGAQALMKHLYQTPVVTIKGVAELLDIKVNTAASLIKDFETQGVLTQLTSKRRNRTFSFSEYMKIFEREIGLDNNPSDDSTRKNTPADTPTDTPTELYLGVQLPDWKVKQLVTRFSGVLSRAEIQSLLELKDTEHLRKQYTLPSLRTGYIEMTLPDKPSSKLQKYRLTAKGISLQEYLTK